MGKGSGGCQLWGGEMPQAGCRVRRGRAGEERVFLVEGTAQTKARSGNERPHPGGNEKPPGWDRSEGHKGVAMGLFPASTLPNA